jgi:hypothetical protein
MPFRLHLARLVVIAAAAAPALIAAPASAQLLGLSIYAPPRPIPPRGIYAVAPHVPLMPPGMAVAILVDQGFRPAGPVALRGEAFVVAALDGRGRPVTVLMDAYDGEILNVTPRAAPPADMRSPAMKPILRGETTQPLPPVRPKQLADIGAAVKPAPGTALSPARALYPPPEAPVLKKLTRPAE